MKTRTLKWAAVVCILISGLVHAHDLATAWTGVGGDNKPIRFDPENMQRPAILLFWATWCPYCKALMPFVQNVANAAGPGGLDVYAIDIQEDSDADPMAELRARGLTFTFVGDGDDIAHQYAVKGTPSLFFVDTHGRIVYKRAGGDAPEKVEANLREQLHLN